MKNIFLLAGLGLFMFTSCSKDDNENNLNSTDESFIMKVAMSNKAEMMAGQLAATKGNSAAVQEFGHLMVSQHGQAQADLETLAGTVGRNLPDSIDAEHLALMARLDTLSGYSFDSAYINSQVTDHQTALDLFQMELNEGNHQGVRTYASQYLPAIQMHFQKADSIKTSL